MFKETKTKTSEQEMADKYQARLEEIRRAIEEEIAMLKPLKKPFSEHRNSTNDDSQEAAASLLKILNWLKESGHFSNLSAKQLENMRVMMPALKKEISQKGLPDIEIPVLTWPDKDWFHKSSGLGIDQAGSNGEMAAMFLPPEDFANENSSNPLALTGVIMTSSSNLRSHAVHETMHFLDFNLPFRIAENKILEEILAFRQQDYVRNVAAEGNWRDRILDALNLYYDRYELKETISLDDFREITEVLIQVIERMDALLKKDATTQILLNSLSIADILGWNELGDDDLKAMIKNKYE